MNLSDLFNREIASIVKSQINYWSPGITTSEINYLLGKIKLDDKWFKIRNIRSYIYYNKFLSQIKELCFYADCAYGVPYPEKRKISEAQVKERLKQDPDNLLLAYFWIYYYLEEMKDEEVYIDLPFFLDEIIDNYPELINLDNFLENSIVKKLDKEEVKISPKLYMYVFKKATRKYPNKKSFRYFLAMSYLYNGDLEFALDILIDLHNWMIEAFKDYQDENIEDNYIFFDYTDLVKGVLKYFEKLSSFNKLIDIAEMVQAIYFSKFKNADPDRYTHADFFIELSFRKMRAFLKLKKMNDLRMEFEKIQPYLKDAENDFWKSEFADVIYVC